jgi:trans-aconitate 2-methyltransferase
VRRKAGTATACILLTHLQYPIGMAENSREWNAALYHQISAPQVSWGKKVLARVSLRGDETVLDAGCGTGRLTRDLLEALPRGRVVALDLSQNMIDQARAFLESDFASHVEFICCDVLNLPFGEEFDGIFSTASFHWVQDHERLFRELYRALRPGGWLCAQCGGGPNIARLLGRVQVLLATKPYAEIFAGFQFPWEFADADTAAARLRAAGFEQVETSVEEAPTTFDSAEDFRRFVESVIMHRHLERIPTLELRQNFMAELTRQAAADDPPFLLDYWRLNLQGRKPG